ncbi:SICAvar type I [Plasmodium knowlesi]|uniref:SICAvar type I n=1 Tax=Plasmodium knowlesi TaxID=5850 RepID=A0A1Y3DRD3_PLAKN|nr:SICAvar type I [Plasmodium knowlesi]
MVTAGGSSGLLQGWFEELLKDKDAADITSIGDDLRKNLEETWKELSEWLVRQESTEIGNFCADTVKYPGHAWKEQYMQVLCNAIAEIKYFMSGVETRRTHEGSTSDKPAAVTELTPAQAYARCVVGAVAFSTIYGDHCHMGEAIKKVEGEFEDKIRGHLKAKDGKPDRSKQLDVCKEINTTDLIVGKALLSSTIKQWTKQKRDAGGPKTGDWKLGRQWHRWKNVCPQGKPHDDTTTPSSTPGQPSVSDVLVNDAYTMSPDTLREALSAAIQSASNGGAGTGTIDSAALTKAIMDNVEKESKENIAKVCMEDSSNRTFCQRLECAKQHWKLTSTQAQGDFWEGHVKGKLEKLLPDTPTTTNDGTNDHCNNGGFDNANKAACKHITEFLNKMNTTQNSNGPNELSNQIINCLLLSGYVKKLKEEAKEKGFCSIDEGIKKAFTTAGNSGSVPCQWNDDDYEKCSITTNGTGPTEAVKNKVDELLKKNDQTKDPKIQETLIDFNKENKLCEWVNCAAKRSEENNSTSGHGTGQEKFWTEDVKKLWQELAGEMTEKGKTENEECNTMDGKRQGTHSEKTACKFLHAGLKQLYDPTTTASTGNDGILSTKYPSSRQAVGCFLLHAYAKHMKDKAVCDIDGGISRAFSLWQDPSSKAPATCKDNGKTCIPCKWADNAQLGECKINTNGPNGPNGSTTQTEVKKKLEKVVKDNDDKDIKDMAKEVNKMDLCQRVQCVTARWNKHDKNKKNGVPRTWDKVWKAIPDEVTTFGTALATAITTENGQFQQYCNHLHDKTGRDACLFIAAGLQNLYNTADNGDAVTASFHRTMKCVLLNAIADKMKEKLPCKEERSVTDGINEAFNKSATIKEESTGCKTNDKCFECVRYNNLSSCDIGENSKKKNVKTTVDELLKTDSNLKDESLEKAICKPCTGEGKKDFCQELNCVVDKWGERKNGSSSGTTTWSMMEEDFKAQLTNLLTHMQEKKKQDPDGKYCTVWSDSDAHGVANKKACQLVVAGLQHISKIQDEYTKDGEDKNENPYDNQEFKQVVSCLMLKAVAQKMKEQSPICYIEPGISKAFEFADAIREEHCQNDKPCIVCKWDDKTKDELDKCTIGKDNDKVEPKLNDLLQTNGTTVNNTLGDLLKTDQPEGVTLCSHLQCLASRVQALTTSNGQGQAGTTNAQSFWEKNGEVEELWKQLAQEMIRTGTNENTECNQMDDNGKTRTPTTPEKKACNYLHAGLKALYNNSPTASTAPAAPAPSPGKEKILDKNPLLRQTVGCLLLHSYAKHMKEKSTCVVDSGIEKAFKAFNDNNNANCNGGSNGKGQCVPCQWNETDYDNCTITTSDETTQTPVKDKLKTVLPDDDPTLTNTIKKINEMNNLCDYIRCAGPKWFKNKKEINASPTHTWCDFWEQDIKTTLTKMFQHMATDGQNKPTSIIISSTCQGFGDGNPDSVERKACNHITAGLKYIKKEINNGHDQLLQQAVACIALNMYADQIKQKSQEKCPIDESKIEKMFYVWNGINSPCNVVNNNGCFKCERVPSKDFNGCKLSVDSNLVDKTTNGNCNTNATDVKIKMEGLLEDKSNTNSIKSNITTTLSFITEMASSFCTQLQCAIKKKLKSNNGKTLPNVTPPSWSDINKDAEGVLTKLLEQMMQSKNQVEVNQYCKDNEDEWNKIGHKEGKTNKAACLLFASGLQHIYTHGNDQKKGPSFGQTMGCLFLKEYAKQLKDLANKKKQGNSWVHPLCDIDSGINYAFEKSNAIMNDTPPCNNGPNSCFECKWENNDYDKCNIGTDNVKTNVKPLLQSKETHMQETLENTVCPILLTDLLTPFLPLAPVSIGLSAMAYYLWKYFGPLGKGGTRFRRSPADIPGPSVQEQLLDHVQQDSSHEYQLVKERKPRSAPTRTKRSGPVNRRTIIEIHFEVLDECQKGDTQLNQKDFLELLVQEFMGSEFMEEEQVPKEDVLMEPVPMELVPIEGVPSLGSGLMV